MSHFCVLQIFDEEMKEMKEFLFIFYPQMVAQPLPSLQSCF